MAKKKSKSDRDVITEAVLESANKSRAKEYPEEDYETLMKYKHLPMVKRMFVPGWINKGVEKHPDYPTGSHRMWSANTGPADNRKYWAGPRLVEKDGQLVKQPSIQTIREGNAIPFDTEEEASRFAHGAWKRALAWKEGATSTPMPYRQAQRILKKAGEKKQKP